MGHDLALFKIELMFPVVILIQLKNQRHLTTGHSNAQWWASLLSLAYQRLQ